MDRERIAEGRTAEVFAWSDGRVLKLYRAGFGRDGAAKEFRVARLVSNAGLAAPAVYDAGSPDGVLEQDGRCGILAERIDGVSMLREMARRPWRVRRYSRQFARLHAAMHSTRIPSLPEQRRAIGRAIDRAADVAGPQLAGRARRALALLPDDGVVCHGDFHPDNVLLSRRGPVIVDWEPVTRGAAAADVARTVLLARHGGFPPGTPWRVRVPMALARRLFLRLYLREYTRITGMPWHEVEAWIGVMAVARTAERIPHEANVLLRIAAQRLLDPGPEGLDV